MGLRVVALDVAEEKLDLARALGAEATVNCAGASAVQEVLDVTGGGAHGVLVTAVSPPAFSQAIGFTRRRGTVVFVGLPPGGFETPIFSVVLRRITLRGSIVGTRKDLDEALGFALRGEVHSEVTIEPFDSVNEVLDRLRRGEVRGRVVLSIGSHADQR